MPFPSPPWSLRGQAWVSLVRAAAPGEGTDTWVTGFVDHQPGGTLSYRELVVARRLGRRAVQVRDLWVDSAASRDGGRSLWHLPKQLGVLTHTASGLGLVGNAEWAATDGTAQIASASFADVARAAVPLPFRFRTEQPREDGPPAVTSVAGRGRSLPCLAHWDFAAEGPLGWLAGRQPLASFRVRDFALVFG